MTLENLRKLYKGARIERRMKRPSGMNKRGQELSVNTLILIIIGVLVLVFLVVGFAIGWKKIFPFIAPENNVKEVADKCNLACNTQDVYNYCTVQRDLRLDEPLASLGKKEFKATCKDLELLKADLGTDVCGNIQCTGGYGAEFKTLPGATTTPPAAK